MFSSVYLASSQPKHFEEICSVVISNNHHEPLSSEHMNDVNALLV